MNQIFLVTTLSLSSSSNEHS